MLAFRAIENTHNARLHGSFDKAEKMGDEESLLKVLAIETNRIGGLDSTLFIIKGWVITLVSAITGFAFARANDGELVVRRNLLAIAIFSTAAFFLIDLVFRNIQLKHVSTTQRIKDILKGGLKTSSSNSNTLVLWEEVWDNETKKQSEGVYGKLVSPIFNFLSDYSYTIIFYVSVMAGLAYLMIF